MNNTDQETKESTYCNTTKQLDSFFKDLIKVQMLDASNSELIQQEDESVRNKD